MLQQHHFLEAEGVDRTEILRRDHECREVELALDPVGDIDVGVGVLLTEPLCDLPNPLRLLLRWRGRDHRQLRRRRARKVGAELVHEHITQRLVPSLRQVRAAQSQRDAEPYLDEPEQLLDGLLVFQLGIFGLVGEPAADQLLARSVAQDQLHERSRAAGGAPIVEQETHHVLVRQRLGREHLVDVAVGVTAP